MQAEEKEKIEAIAKLIYKNCESSSEQDADGWEWPPYLKAAAEILIYINGERT